jgi:hypothetical protein
MPGRAASRTIYHLAFLDFSYPGLAMPGDVAPRGTHDLREERIRNRDRTRYWLQICHELFEISIDSPYHPIPLDAAVLDNISLRSNRSCLGLSCADIISVVNKNVAIKSGSFVS